MARRKLNTKRFNQRYGTAERTDLRQQRNEAVLRASEPKPAAKKKAAAAAAK